LRRSVGIAVAQGDGARFALASTQYVERYLYSPYASQFADSFVSGVITLHMSISQDKLADITAMMDPEREKVIYLRIARRAAIDGLSELSAFASARAEQGRDGNTNQGDPRALLYSSLSTVTSDTTADVRAKLGKIDRSKLSDGDRALLDAAQVIAGEMVAPPASAASQPKPEVAAVRAADEAGLPPVEGAVSEQPAAPPSGGTVPSAPNASAPSADAATVLPASAPADSAAPDTTDPTDAAMMKTRRQLDLIDQMLGAAPK
jgi:chemotaxis protein MotC